MAGRLDYGAPFFTPDLGFMHPLRQSVSFCAVLYKLFYFFLIRDFYTKRHKTAHFRESARPPANGLAMLVQAAPSPPGVASAGRLGKPALWNGTRGGTGGAWHGCWRRGSRALAVAMLIPLGSVAVMAPQQKNQGEASPVPQNTLFQMQGYRGAGLRKKRKNTPKTMLILNAVIKTWRQPAFLAANELQKTPPHQRPTKCLKRDQKKKYALLRHPASTYPFSMPNSNNSTVELGISRRNVSGGEAPAPASAGPGPAERVTR